MAYTRLLRVCYRREKGIPPDEAYRLVRASTKAHRGAVDRVLAEFFTQSEDGWHQKRADAEIEAYQAQCNHNRIVGPLGGRPKKTTVVSENPEINNPSGSFRVSQNNPNQEPLTTNHKPEPEAINQKKQRSKTSDAVASPDWLPPEWQEFEQHRKEKHQTLTPTARQGCIAKLARWREEGRDIVQILRNSIDNGYTGLFETNGARGRSVQAHNIASAQEFVRRGELEDDNAKPTS